MNQESPSREAIAERAYLLWERAGRPAGRDQEFWLRAEAELAAPMSAGEVPPIIPPPIPTPPPILTASPVHQVPPPIKNAVKTPGRRPPRPRGPKRA